MLGLIPNLLERIIVTTADADTLAEVKRRADIPLDRTYELNTLCPDEEWQRFLAATCEVLNLSAEEAESIYAEFFYKDGLERWPTWFEMASNSREFLQRQPAIHNTFASSIHEPSARKTINDKFRVEVKDNVLTTYYSSPNQLCGLYKKLARLIIDHYGDDASVDEPCCLKRGDSQCEIHVTWNNESV